MRPIWVIYKNPTDFPGVRFVMREHHIEDGVVTPSAKTWQAASINKIRQFVPKDKTRMERADKDEAQIVEWWF
jgi:hypothetical protein